jgi:outer membrane protein assembly factor BamB
MMLYLMIRNAAAICLLALGGIAAASPPGFEALKDSDWPWWRGPARNGVANAGQDIPTEWSDQKNIAWSVDIPGRGNGSPIAVGNRVYLATCNEESGSQSVLCVDRATGAKVWEAVVHATGAMRKNERSTGASTTPACDGRRVYINFANSGAVFTTALDLQGQQVWQTKICDYSIHQGYGSSPALYEKFVFVTVDTKGGGAVAALDHDNGKIIWKRERPSDPNYPSPIILNVAGRDQLLLTGCNLISSFEPRTGKTIWEVEGATTECVTSTVTDGKHVYSSGGYPRNHISAVLADGSKKIVWQNEERVYVPSMICHDGFLYAVLDAGIAACWKSDTGEEQWKTRLGGNFSASLVLVGDRIYATNESGETSVFRASPDKLDLIGKNQLGEEAFSTPAVCGNQIFMRYAVMQDGKRQEKLACIMNR